MARITEWAIQNALRIWLDGDTYRDGTIKTSPALRPGVVWWHTPNGGARSAIEGKRFKDIGVKAGMHDVLFLNAGRLYGLELKDEDGTLSREQVDMHARLLRAGMAASATVYNLADAKAQIRAWNLVNDR